MGGSDEVEVAEEQPRERVAGILRQAIQRGEVSPGDALPSSRELAKQHDVAINTAQSALRLLATEGLVEIRAGSRARVRKSPLKEVNARTDLQAVQQKLERVQRELDSVQSIVKRISESS
ncbi:GntR family transcriptional regulator [Nocardiopsis aegyptia]|uniref:GntR family transcriptional regulator n=1 Tax=Nocardiopsis aegyptia TaxID=220378 RepID=UPI00366A57FD